MHHTRVSLCLLIAAGLFFAGCATRPLTKQDASYPSNDVDARGLFAENCAICHGENGRAHTFHGILVGAQNLSKPKFQENISDDAIRNAIVTGPSVMPAFGKKLSPTEIDALARYVRTFAQKN
jgi:mono/diheme cytochrome c family protein